MLGDAEYYSEQGKAGRVIRIDGGGVKEWIFTGKLRAETPFYFGIEAKGGDQTSLSILLDKKGRYRIPRSVLRGALRRDLKAAFVTGCDVELGGSRPCDCPVCMVMRGITVMDTKSDYAEPLTNKPPAPEVRHRIRRNQFSGTVDEGALFDIEVGPEGITFPFVMRYRGQGEKPPSELTDVIHLWKEEMAFLGGSASTGKGRFSLEPLDVFQWDLTNPNSLKDYIEYSGLRGIEAEFTGAELQELSKGLSIFQLPDKSNNYHSQWIPVTCEISIQSPLLSNDPIAALFDPKNHDAVAYKKRVWKDGGIIDQNTFKGESIRGILRTALGRTHTHKQDNKERYLFELEHEDCTCALCTIFGNEHETGKIRFEDLKIEDEVGEKHLDHVAIDRFTGGAVDKKKFDDSSLAGSPGKPIKLEGCFWLRADISSDDKKKLINAFCDVRDGLYPLGAKGGVGYGWVKELKITEGPIELPAKEIPPESIPSNYSFPPLPPLQIEANKVYSPHYFLEPAEIENEENRNDYWAVLDEQGTEDGYLKFTGLNMANQEQFKSPDDNYPSEDIESLKVLLNSWPPDQGWTEDQKRFFMDKLFRPAPTAPQSAFFHENEFTDKLLISTLCTSIRNDYSISLLKNDDSIEWLNNLIRYPAFYDNVVKKLPRERFSWKIKDLSNRTQQGRGKKDYSALNKSQKTLVSKLNRLVIESLYHKAPKMRDRKPYKYPRPLLIVIKDNKRYTIPKRCERIFYGETDVKHHVSRKVADQYCDIIRDCKNNYGKIDKKFLTILPGETLKSGDLVYFTQANGEVKAIMPVRISRITDTLPLGKRLRNDDLRPCEREILGDFDTSSLNKFSEKMLFRLHENGLCPSCRLFGTTHYKGRVRFGFARHKGEEKWLMADSKDKYLTLPLLERPRPTWSMPSDEDDVPGRKFYVHHNGWEKVKQDSRGNKTSKTENNRSVEPLDKDNLFEFDLFFENLKEWELGLLLYSLELQNGMAHKLGMAKAFGFGSVKIDADNILLKKSPNQNLHEANCDEDTGEMEKSEIKWQDATNGKGCWLQKGFDVLGSWFDENWEQVEPANDIKEIKEIKIPGVEHIKGLRSLLQIPEELDKAKVRYPALETKDDSEKLPGYVELDDEDEEGGREYLKRPWQPWYPMLKRSTKEGATKRSSKDTKKHPENSTEKGTTGNFGKIIFPKEISRALKSSTEEKITGRVKWFNHQKEYGFIECDNRGDVFVHKSGIKDYHRDIDYKGKDVKFSVTQGEKGPNACNVELIEQEEM